MQRANGLWILNLSKKNSERVKVADGSRLYFARGGNELGPMYEKLVCLRNLGNFLPLPSPKQDSFDSTASSIPDSAASFSELFLQTHIVDTFAELFSFLSFGGTAWD